MSLGEVLLLCISLAAVFYGVYLIVSSRRKEETDAVPSIVFSILFFFVENIFRPKILIEKYFLGYGSNKKCEAKLIRLYDYCLNNATSMKEMNILQKEIRSLSVHIDWNTRDRAFIQGVKLLNKAKWLI